MRLRLVDALECLALRLADRAVQTHVDDLHMPRNGVEWRSQLVAHGRQKSELHGVRLFRRRAGALRVLVEVRAKERLCTEARERFREDELFAAEPALLVEAQHHSAKRAVAGTERQRNPRGGARSCVGVRERRISPHDLLARLEHDALARAHRIGQGQ